MRTKLTGRMLSTLIAFGAAGLGFAQSWSNQDIGTPGMPGSTSPAPDAAVRTIVGGGNDIWGNADNFQFNYAKVTGAFDVQVRVESLEMANTWSKAGLMARESLAPGSRHADILATPTGGQNIFNMQWRDTTDGGSGSKAGAERLGPVPYPNAWVRLVRADPNSNEFKSYIDLTGASATTPDWGAAEYHVYTIPGDLLPESLFIGLAVTSHDNALSAEAVFANLTFNVGAPIPAAAPAIVQEPLDLTVGQGQGATFSVTINDAEVFPPPAFQWTLDAVDIPGATGASYTIARVTAADTGAQFAVRVTNSQGTATSLPATLTVIPDDEAPTLVAVTGSLSFTQVKVTFSEPVDPTTAEDPFNYTLTGGLAVSGAQLAVPAGTPGDNVVILTTGQQAVASSHTLTVNNVTDIAGNVIAAASTMEFSTFIWKEGLVLHEYWDGATANTIAAFIADPRYPNAPTWASLEPLPEYPPNGGSGPADNYWNKLSLWFVPAEDTYYEFYISGDDNAQLRLSTDGDPANRLLIAVQGGWSNARNWLTGGNAAAVPADKRSGSYSGSEWPEPNVIMLSPGNKYYMEALHSEGGGGDNVGVTMTMPWLGDADPADGTAPSLEGSLIGVYLDPNGAGVNITGQPQNALAAQNRDATFSVVATGMSAYGTALTYQWQMAPAGSATFTDIAGATADTYTTPMLALADDGNQYRVVCSVPVLEVTSDAAVLTVSEDGVSPMLVSAGAISGDNQVGVAFNELLDQASAETAANYQVSGATVTAATLRSGMYVQLDLAGTAPASFTVTASGVKDLAGNPNDATTVDGAVSSMMTMDVGVAGTNPLLPGDAFSFGEAGYYVAGGGADIWGAADGFQFVYQQFTGAFDMITRVESLSGPNTWTKAAVMVRESLQPGSRNSCILVTRTAGQNLYNMQWRDATDAASASKAGAERFSPVLYPNAWIRLVRENAVSNELKCYLIKEGSTWELYHTYTLPDATEGLLPETVYVGMAVTSHDNNAGVALGEAIFQQFSVTEYQDIVDPNLAITSQDGSIVITWDAGTLVGAPDVTGPYTPVAGATSPHPVTPSGGASFYQIAQ